MINMLGIKTVKFQRCVQEGSLALRVYRLTDLSTLYSLFTPKALFDASGTQQKAFGSLLSFYAWIRSTFQIIYLIEVQEDGGRRIVGFSGLYKIRAGQSLWLSLEIFSQEDRGRGFGRHALELLLHTLQENGAAETVNVEVFTHNVPSLHLFEKLGFEACSRCDDRLVLQKYLVTRQETT